jgi:hypothetical protein
MLCCCRYWTKSLMWQHSCSVRIQTQAVPVSRWWWICAMPWLVPFQEVTACMIQWYEQWRCLLTGTFSSFFSLRTHASARMHMHTCTYNLPVFQLVSLANSILYWGFSKSVRQISFLSGLCHCYSTWSTNWTCLIKNWSLYKTWFITQNTGLLITRTLLEPFLLWWISKKIIRKGCDYVLCVV